MSLCQKGAGADAAKLVQLMQLLRRQLLQRLKLRMQMVCRPG